MWLAHMPDIKEWDVVSVSGALLAFVLPLTLLWPNFSVWTVIPKVQVTRFHILAQSLSWAQLNAALFALLSLLFCIHLEIRKRKLDEIVERVMLVSQATDKTVEVEGEKQTAAMRACVQLLDASAEQYEHLVLLRDELRARGAGAGAAHQRPPVIENSSQDL